MNPLIKFFFCPVRDGSSIEHLKYAAELGDYKVQFDQYEINSIKINT